MCCVQSVLQGLDAPLVPNTAVAKVLETGATAAGGGNTAAATTTKTAEEKGASKPQADTNKSTNGRKLLQRHRTANRGNNWSAQNTQSAIRAAASGRVPASYATARGSQNARGGNRGCVNCMNWM